MGKVKLTQEQADAIRRIKKDTDGGITNGNIRNHLRKGWGIPPYRALNDLSTKEFLDALYIGYEVEPEYKENDWLNYLTIHGDLKTDKVIDVSDDRVLMELSNSWVHFNNVKSHATPSEIAEEKEHRWWAKHGRDVWELKDYDLLKGLSTGLIYQVFIFGDDLYVATRETFENVEQDDIAALKQMFEIACFAEDRKDV